MTAGDLQVVTFWYGDKYGPEYPKRLRSMLERNLQLHFDWHVLTMDTPRREGLGFPKLNVYRTDLGLHGPVLMLDLDLVIRADITDTVFWGLRQVGEGAHIIGMAKWKPCKFPLNTSMVMFRGGSLGYVWDEFEAAPPAHDEEHYLFPKLVEHGARISFWPRGTIHPWRRGDWPPETKVLSFNGEYKPHMLPNEPDVERHWK